MVARLQQFSTYGLLKRAVLRLLGDQLRGGGGVGVVRPLAAAAKRCTTPKGHISNHISIPLF